MDRRAVKRLILPLALLLAPAWAGAALQFSGSAVSQLDLGNSATLAPGTAFTIFMTIQASSVTDHDMFLASKHGNAADRGWEFNVNGGGSGVLDLSVSALGVTYNFLDGVTVLTPGVWYTVVASYDGTAGFQRLYVNGVRDAETTTTVPASVFNASVNETIGSAGNGTPQTGFYGKIDEVCRWNVALTDEEIRHLAAPVRGLALQYRPANIVYYFSLQEPFAGTVFDKGPNNYKLNATPTAVTLVDSPRLSNP